MRGPRERPAAPCVDCNKISKLIRKLYCNTCYRRHYVKGELSRKIIPSELTLFQKETMEGLLLGDGCLYRRKATHNPYFTVRRAKLDKDYLAWTSGIFENFVCEEKDGEVYDSRTGKTYFFSKFRTHRASLFNEYYELWYPKGIKIVPKDSLKLTPNMIALWYCDDGHIKVNKKGKIQSLKLSTNGFVKEDVIWLADEILKFNIKFSLAPYPNDQWVLKANQNNTNIFCEFIDSVYPSCLPRKKKWDFSATKS